MESDKDMEKLKKRYETIREKYNLPGFDSLAEEFDIERAVEKETSFILRDIRRVINEKISAYMHLFEILMNPINPPMFIFLGLKNATDDERKTIKEIYKKLAKLELEMMRLDTIYNEEKEAEFLKIINKEWHSLKDRINKLLDRFDKGLEESNSSTTKGYFG